MLWRVWGRVGVGVRGRVGGRVSVRLRVRGRVRLRVRVRVASVQTGGVPML
jgi:hypothetical protein